MNVETTEPLRPVTLYPADPPVGTAGPVFALPSDVAALQLVSVYFNLTTSATAGTRRMTVVGLDGTTRDYFALPFSGQTLASIYQAIYCASVGSAYESASNYYTAPLPPGPFPPGMSIRLKGLQFSSTDKVVHVHITYQPLY